MLGASQSVGASIGVFMFEIQRNSMVNFDANGITSMLLLSSHSITTNNFVVAPFVPEFTVDVVCVEFSTKHAIYDTVAHRPQ